MSTIFMFPGQGAQQPEMLRRLPDTPVVRATLDEACTQLGVTLAQLDSGDALQSTRAVQLCLLIGGVASARLLVEAGCTPDMVLGLSIGAYPAAVSAGWLGFADALELVRLRGRLMEEAYPHGYGMSAVLGLSLRQVERLVAEVTQPEAPLFIANVNSPDQVVVAGHEAALARLAELATGRERARKVSRVAISVPSHCSLLDAQAAILAAAFARVTLARPSATYISSSSARALFNAAAVSDDLANNMARQVHWHDAITHARERGAHFAVEMHPGATLTQLSRAVLAGHGDAVALSQTPVGNIVCLAQRYHE